MLDAGNDQWFLISADVLGGSMNWQQALDYCNTVHNSFSSLEQSAVASTTKTDEAYSTFAASDLNNAKLFLLSAYEATTYFISDSDRLPGGWWLRSLRKDNRSSAGVVIDGGYLRVNNVNVVNKGARPAFHLNLASVLFSSAAAGRKSSAAAGGGKFGKSRGSVSAGRKLTLKDGARTGFTASASSSTVAPGGTLAVTYSGANTGTKEYISAMLCDASGVAQYYASLTSAGSGTWNMTIPSGLAEGIYTLNVFSEQQNGNYNTDYASAFISIPLTVGSTVPETYTVTWKSQDGNTILETDAGVASGSVYSYDGTEPTKADDSQYSYTFDGWAETTNAESGKAVSALGTVSGDKTWYAAFSKTAITRQVTVSVEPTAGGTAFASPTSGTNGTDVALTATPGEGYRFKEWQVTSGGVTITDNKFSIGTADVAIKAVFETIPTYTISVSADPAAGGTVTGAGSYNENTTVTVTATAEEGYDFDGWYEGEESVSGAASYTFTATADRTLTAMFEKLLTYTAIWLDGDGTVLDSKEYIFDSEEKPHTDKTPTKAADENYTYSFTGWDEGIWVEDETSMTLIFTPQFVPVPIVRHQLTINYVYADNTTAAETHNETLVEGAEYSVASSTIEGFTPDQAVVSGTMGTADITVTVTYTANSEHVVEYSTVSGDGQIYVKQSDTPLDFRIQRNVDDTRTYDLFKALKNDDVAVAERYFTKGKGSVIVSLKPEYIDTLALGMHTLTFVFEDGEATASFTVKAVPGSFEDVAMPSDTFTFRKVWEGGSGSSIDFTLYQLGGTVYHHGFDKKIVSATEWNYNAWFSSPVACYVIEKPVSGYTTRYENVGVYAGITDRCCDGGTIVNYKVPKTGDESDLTLWLGCVLAGLTIISIAVYAGKRKKAHS